MNQKEVSQDKRFTYRNTIDVKDYNALRDAVKWGALAEDQARSGLEHSAYVISCYDGEHIAGSARMIWDQGYICYLADVMVMPEYQGMGIGKHMVQSAIDYMRAQKKKDWIIKCALTAAKGKEPFYEKLGFEIRPNEIGGSGMDMKL